MTKLGGGRIRFVAQVLIVVALAVAPMATGLAPASLAAPSSFWRGEYYNNLNLVGSPVLVRDDTTVDFHWRNGSPGSGVDANQFSVRWTGYRSFAAGTYVFYITVDDGARLWVDGQMLIDQWRDQSETTHSASKHLSAGYHSLRLEYYENSGSAVCKLWWSDGASSAWRGEYYNNTSLGGGAAMVRDDGSINFDWGYGSPSVGVNSDNFSVRWTRSVHFGTSRNYTFSATTDDGVRVYVDGSVIIDKWYHQSPTTHTATVYLAAGTHQVKVEYFEATGVAVCRVSWSEAAPPVIGPTYSVNAPNGLRLRRGPSLAHGVVLVLHHGDRVSTLGTTIHNQGIAWAKVAAYRWGRYYVGYCASAYLVGYDAPPGGDESGLKVIGGALNLRSGPGLGYAMCRTVPYGTVLRPTGATRRRGVRRWSEVYVDGTTLWADSQYLVAV